MISAKNWVWSTLESFRVYNICDIWDQIKKNFLIGLKIDFMGLKLDFVIYSLKIPL